MSASVISRHAHVNYLWDDQAAAKLSPAAQLIYRSNLLGSDQRITNTGGGNTSAKLRERDPLTGAEVEVLWVKGSGGDLRTSVLANFASLYQEKLLGLQPVYAAAGERGPKTPAEDHMVTLYPHCTFNLNPRAASIDTPLHSFVPARHVDHMHPNAVIAVAAARRSKELAREIFGEEVGWTPWLRPGFELGLEIQRRCEQQPSLKGLILGQHGLINWANDGKQCYELTLRLIEQAANYIEARDKGAKTFGGARHEALGGSDRDAVLFEILPWLRGQISTAKRFIATLQHDDRDPAFRQQRGCAATGRAGHLLPGPFPAHQDQAAVCRLGSAQQEHADASRKPCVTGLEQYRKDYAAYYETCKRPDSPAMRDPNPTVILIPGIGMIAWGKDKSESRVTAEFYNCAVEVMRGAEAIDEYIALPQQEAFDIEYWLLEEAKLRRMPAEKELARNIVLWRARATESARRSRKGSPRRARTWCARTFIWTPHSRPKPS